MLIDAVADRVATAHLLSDLIAQIGAAAQMVTGVLGSGGKVLFFGNGGSAATAEHLAAELVGRFLRERPGLPALALTAGSSTITALGNDYGFANLFARQITALGAPGDVAVAMSASGTSPNVISGVAAARAAGLATIGLSGCGSAELATQVDQAIVIPTQQTALVQEAHLAVGHMICAVVDAALAPDNMGGQG